MPAGRIILHQAFDQEALNEQTEYEEPCDGEDFAEESPTPADDVEQLNENDSVFFFKSRI